MLGAFGVGKTSLVARYVYSIFSEKYHTTIGVKIDKKIVEVGENAVNLVIWDVYGEDHQYKVQPFYIKGSSGYLLVADGTRPETLERAVSIQQRAEQVLGKLPFVLMINKSDLEWTTPESDIKRLRDIGWTVMYTSAKTGETVEAAFGYLAQQMVNS
jgi:small GTP-binding protein